MSDRLLFARTDFISALGRIHSPAQALRALRGLRELLRSEEVLPATAWIIRALAVVAGATALANTLLFAQLGPGPLVLAPVAGAVFLHGAAIISITAAASWLAAEQRLVTLVAALGLFSPVAMLVATAQGPVSTGSIAGQLLFWIGVAALVRVFHVPEVAYRLLTRPS